MTLEKVLNISVLPLHKDIGPSPDGSEVVEHDSVRDNSNTELGTQQAFNLSGLTPHGMLSAQKQAETSSGERLKLARERDFLQTKHEGDDENIRQRKERYCESQETLYLVLALQCDLKPLKFLAPRFLMS